MTDTNLAQAVEATNNVSSYDANIKFLLADKQILARILKYVVQEFKDFLTKAQIISCGYTEEEFAEAENLLCTNAQEFVTTKHKTVARGTLGM